MLGQSTFGWPLVIGGVDQGDLRPAAAAPVPRRPSARGNRGNHRQAGRADRVVGALPDGGASCAHCGHARPLGRRRRSPCRSPPRPRHGAVAAPAAPDAPFGSVFGPAMAVARFDGVAWSAPEVVALESFALHPGTHALHYGSSCFEGLKAHRQPGRRASATFRADAHVARLRQSTARLCLPVPPADARRRAHRHDRRTPTRRWRRRRRARCTCARRCSARTSRSAPRRRRARRRSSTCWPARSATTCRRGR